MTYRLQAEWQHLSRVMSLASNALSPVEAAIHSKFLPALLGVESIDVNFRSLLNNRVKQEGIVIRDPTQTDDIPCSYSCSATNLLVDAILQNS